MSDPRHSRTWLLAGVALAALAAPAIALAQTAQPANANAAPGTALEEIVVTATRREEQLQSVPISITALSEAAIERLQVHDLHSLERVAPSLNISRSQADRTSIIVALRGLVQTDQLAPIDPAVGVYLDGIYSARSTGGNAQMIDLQRVEVLRGPQGTLFGRNTIGGAVNIVSNKPQPEFGGSIEATAGNYRLVKLTGVLNLPLSDRLATRLAASFTRHSGYAKNGVTGGDLANLNAKFVRVQASYDISPDWNLLVGGDYTHTTNDGEWATNSGSSANTAAATLAQLAPYIDPYARTVYPNYATGFKGRTGGVSAVLTGKLGPATFKSITAYRLARKRYGSVDFDGSPYFVQGQIGGFSRQHQWSQEFQLFGKALDNRLDWIAGLYGFEEFGIDNTLSMSAVPIPVPATQILPRLQSRASNRSIGAYAQLTYNLTEALRATGGIRYTRDYRSVTAQNAFQTYPSLTPAVCGVAGSGPLPDCNFSPPAAVFHAVPFTVGLDYKVDRTLFYAKLSRGFRSGGFNVRPSGATAAAAASSARSISAPFRPEKVLSYEAGVKSDLLDNRLRINLAVYNAQYTDIQLTQQVPSPPPQAAQSFTVNAGKARIRGVEIETTAVLGDLTLSASGSLIDPKYTKLLPGVTGVLLGSNFQFVAKYNYVLAADYTIAAGYGEWMLHVDYNYKGRTFFTVVPPGNPLAVQPGYDLLNASVQLQLKSRPITLSAWVQNLANEKYLVRGINVPGSVAGTVNIFAGFPGDPRTFGATAKYRF
jgi:iron complex outermembrane receptor protein